MRTAKEVDHAFTAVKKLSPSQTQRLLNMEVRFKEMATDILDQVPESADRTSALRKLLETKMMCSQAITHQKSPEEALNKAPVETTKEKFNAESQT